MTALETLERLVDAIDANAAKTGSAGRDAGYIRLDWVARELAQARQVLAEERCESVVG